MESISKVIDYLWQDEAKDWESLEGHRKVAAHIFCDLVEAKLKVFNLEHSSQSRPRDYMYAESPFDLGSDADDDYRNIVDSLIKN